MLLCSLVGALPEVNRQSYLPQRIVPHNTCILPKSQEKMQLGGNQMVNGAHAVLEAGLGKAYACHQGEETEES